MGLFNRKSSATLTDRSEWRVQVFFRFDSNGAEEWGSYEPQLVVGEARARDRQRDLEKSFVAGSVRVECEPWDHMRDRLASQARFGISPVHTG